MTIETYYLIDYENVGGNGIVGCKGLDRTNHIHLFYTENARKIDLNFFAEHGQAELCIHKAPVRSQSLDMHLVTYLGYLIGLDQEHKGQYRIVSKDTDFDNIVKFWKQELNVEVSRIAKIGAKPRAKAQPQTGKSRKAETVDRPADKPVDKTVVNNEIQQVLSKEGLTGEIIGFVASAVVKNIGEKNGKQVIYRSIISEYGQEKGLAIYRSIRGLIP